VRVLRYKVDEVQSPPLTTHLHLKSQIQAEADKSGGSGDGGDTSA
jgi:hypothetical protein